MSGGTISGNSATKGGGGGGVYVAGGTFTMQNGTISGNSASNFGGGVFVYKNSSDSNTTFIKIGGTIYGDTDNVFGNGNDTDNTATHPSYLGTSGHAVLYNNSGSYYYRNQTLGNTTSGNISATDTLPTSSGQTVGNWTMR
jgi:hypothetical protein